MRNKLSYFILSLLVIVLGMVGCKKDLDTTYTNNPNFLTVYNSGSDVEGQVSSLFNAYYSGGASNDYGVHSYYGVQMMLATASDNFTCSWGNEAMRDMSYEPRNNAWNNATSYTYAAMPYNFFNQMYSVINTASLALKAINSGVQIGTNGADIPRSKAVAKFMQGIAYGQLALVFDKAFITTEYTTPANSFTAAKPYSVVADSATGFLDAAIAIASSNTFTIPRAWFGLASDISSTDFVKLCNTYAASIMSYLPRNNTQLLAVNWTKVKTYATAGITADFNVVSDNNIWYDEAGGYLTASGWACTDMYVVNMMDPTQPQTWPNNITSLPASTSSNIVDQRLNTDFTYVPSTGFQTARGYYHFSNYRLSRYDAVFANNIGPKPEILKAENDLLLAEANAYLGGSNLTTAVNIINAGTRVTRGQMTALASNANIATVVNAIHHERCVELILTGYGIGFFEMRKLNLLQKGTPLHLPIPGKTIALFPDGVNYTFGYIANADGIGTSNGGWK